MGRLEDDILGALLRLRDAMPDLQGHFIVFPASRTRSGEVFREGDYALTVDREVTVIHRDGGSSDS